VNCENTEKAGEELFMQKINHFFSVSLVVCLRLLKRDTYCKSMGLDRNWNRGKFRGVVLSESL